MGKKKKEFIQLERESVIPILKPKLVSTFSEHIEDASEQKEFVKFCNRVESTIRAWYHLQFEDLMHMYTLFDPIYGGEKLKQQNLLPEDIDVLEHKFLTHLFQIMEKSNFRIMTDEEQQVAKSGQYLLNLPIKVDEHKLDKELFPRYFRDHPQENLPAFADKFITFRRGIGIDRTTNRFIQQKIDTIIARIWRGFLTVTLLKRLIYRKRSKARVDPQKTEGVVSEVEDEDLHVERIRIENMKLSGRNLFGKVTIQEPTFERIIVVYRRAPGKKVPKRGIYLKHFKNIPMADMELVLPEKINPSLTPVDWVKFLVGVVTGLVTLISSLKMPKADFRVVAAILSGVVGYCVKIHFSFQQKIIAYQSLITQSMYDKQLDSGRATLLHLCDDVIQQEVKEVIVSYFVLMQQGHATIQELDLRCEQLIREEFDEQCNFEVLDAVQKLEKLGIVSLDSTGKVNCVPLKDANEILGMTTEETVINATQGNASTPKKKKKEHEDKEEESVGDVVVSILKDDSADEKDNNNDFHVHGLIKRQIPNVFGQ